MNKKISVFILAILMGFVLRTDIFASRVASTSKLQEVYDQIFLESKTKKNNNITCEEDVYPFILNNMRDFLVEDNYIKFNGDILTYSQSEREIIFSTLNKFNNLIKSGDIRFDKDMRIIDNSNNKMRITPMMSSLNLIGECDLHVREFRNFIDNQALPDKTKIIIIYWVEKVKPGGAWDYKSYMGYNTDYYCFELGKMTGEQIGNFHYGYVGSVYFGREVLKFGSGFANLFYGHGFKWEEFLHSYCDDPNDIRIIERGINEYYSRNSC